MKQTYISDLKDHVGEVVTLKGWLFNSRSSGKVQFLILRDGTGLCQCIVFIKNVSPEEFEAAKSLTQESSFIITGTVKKEERAVGGYELDASKLEVVSIAKEYPITPKEHGVEFLSDLRHLWVRSHRQWAILRIRHEIIKTVRNFFDDRGFTLFDAPIFTPNACEGTTTLFETPYFDEGSAYLTQSGQLYGEAGAMALGKAYVFGPTFRAEKSKTRRHLTEFWMVEPEMAYYDLNMNMDLMEEFVEHIVQTVLKNRRTELEVLERDITKLENIKRPFPRISYDEAVKIIHGKGLQFEYGNDLGAPDEAAISEDFDRPVMVHTWPKEVKAFYMKEDENDHSKAKGVDMLAPEGYGEIIGGAQREDNYDILLQKIKDHQLPMEQFEWYLDLRRYGSVPHSGFGMGIERTVSWICGLHHVRETIPFPRLMGRLTP